MLQHRPLVFLDIETTGGSAVDSRITEIGALRVESGEVVATFSKLINPEQHVPSFITRLTGIDDSMVVNAPTFPTIAGELQAFLDGAVFVAHNVQFDYGFIKASYYRMGQTFNMDRFCTAQLSRRLYPGQRRHNLDTIVQAHGITVVNRHRALDDAQALHEFFQSALRQHGDGVYAAVNRIFKVTTTSSKPLTADGQIDLSLA
jgi:DNA polymerase-3 subunit epsilon